MTSPASSAAGRLRAVGSAAPAADGPIETSATPSAGEAGRPSEAGAPAGAARHLSVVEATAAEAGCPSEAGSPSRSAGRLSPAADRILRAARLWITLNRPYYSRALFACPVVPTDELPTMAIDERWRIYVNSEFVESRTVEQTAAVLIHELNHGLRSHADRARNSDVGPGAVDVWNYAADCEINDDLVEDGLDVEGGVLPETFGLSEHDTAEQYYRELIRKAAVVEVELRCGSGCSGHSADGEIGPGEPGGADGVERELLRRIVAAAVTEHERAQGCGSVPAGLRRWADDTLTPRVDWRRVLASAVRRGVHLRAGAADYSWQRPSRRDLPGDPVVRPGMTRPVPDVAVVVDTSGSMGEDDLARALAEIRAILTRVVPGDAVRIYSTDADVAAVDQVFNTRQINLTGGGGTDMRVGIAAAAESKPAVIIVITDGFTPWPDAPPPGVPVTIAALTGEWALNLVPPWMQAIDLSVGE